MLSAITGSAVRHDRNAHGRSDLLLQRLNVHAPRKEIAILLFESAGGFRGGSGEVLPKLIQVPLPKERERPNPAHLMLGNWIVLDPVPAGVLVEISTGVGALVDR